MAQVGTNFPKVRRMLLCFYPLIFKHFLASFHAASRAHRSCHSVSSETDPHILERWGYADEVHLGKLVRAKDFGLECMRDVQRLLWILHVGLVSACLSSSVRLTKTSAARYPAIRNPIVVYLMSCTTGPWRSWLVSRQTTGFPVLSHDSCFFNMALHFCHHSFETFC